MKKEIKGFALLLLTTLTLAVTVGCGEHDEAVDSTATYERWQNEMYSTVLNGIVGTWAGLETRSSSTASWTETKSPWSYYTFRSDGTYTELNSSIEHVGTYSIYKNNDYLNHYLTAGMVYIDLNDNTYGTSSTRSVTITGGKLYLEYIVLGIPSSATIRYTKQ